MNYQTFFPNFIYHKTNTDKMAETDMLQRMLEINTRIEKKTSSGARDQIIEAYSQIPDSSHLVPPQEAYNPEDYNPNAEMERIKESYSHGGPKPLDIDKKKIPKYIVEEMLRNPIDMSAMAEKVTDDDKWKDLENKLKKSGLKASADIINKMETNEKKAVNESVRQPIQNNSTFDYGTLKAIIEQVIDEKFDKMRTSLNESIALQNNIPSMKLLNFKDNFYFVDQDNNVFECVMKYKGKRKTKK